MSRIILPGKRNWTQYERTSQHHPKSFISRLNGIRLMSSEAEVGLYPEFESKTSFEMIKVAFPDKRDTEIKDLLKANKNDLLSVFEILSAKTEGRDKVRQPNIGARQGKVSGLGANSVLDKLRSNRARIRAKKQPQAFKIKKEAAEQETLLQIEGDRRGEKIGKGQEPQIEWQEVVAKLKSCQNDQDLYQTVGNLKHIFDKQKSKEKRLKAENYILKMGIKQRKENTKDEIRERIILEKQVQFLEAENFGMRQSNSLQTHSHLGGWQQSDFDGRPGF